MSWASTDLSTIATLTRHEDEIVRLKAGAAADYLCDGVDIADATAPITDGVSSLYTGAARGVLEIDVVAATALTIAAGHALAIAMYDSADDVTFAEIHSGARLYYRAASGTDVTVAAGTVLARWTVPSDAEDYIKPVISSSASNAGTLDIYSVSTWESKIEVAKERIGNALEIMLTNRGVVVDEAGGDVLLDTVANPLAFRLASDYLALALIYKDLSRMQSENYYGLKSDDYMKLYYQEYNSALKRLNLDYDADGTTDERRVNWQGEFRR